MSIFIQVLYIPVLTYPGNFIHPCLPLQEFRDGVHTVLKNLHSPQKDLSDLILSMFTGTMIIYQLQNGKKFQPIKFYTMDKHSETHFESAFENILAGNLKEAAEILEERHKEQPSNIHILLELGNVYYILCEMTKSIASYKKVLDLKPESPYVMYRIGVALYRSTHFSEAAQVFNRIIESGKHLPMTYLWLGLCYYHLGKEEKSIECYKTLIAYGPETVMANYYMGIALKSSGKYDEAVVHFERLLNKTDQHISALYHLGRTHMKNHHYDKAKEYFKKVIELDPENKNAVEMWEYLIND